MHHTPISVMSLCVPQRGFFVSQRAIRPQSAGLAQAHSSPSRCGWASQGFDISGGNVTGKSVLPVAFTGLWGVLRWGLSPRVPYTPPAEQREGPELKPCGQSPKKAKPFRGDELQQPTCLGWRVKSDLRSVRGSQALPVQPGRPPGLLLNEGRQRPRGLEAAVLPSCHGSGRPQPAALQLGPDPPHPTG